VQPPTTDSARIVEQALSFRTPDRLPVYNDFWEFEERWRHERRPAGETPIEDHYWIDLKVVVAAEQLFPSRMGDVEHRGDYVYHDDGWGRIQRKREGAYFAETVERVLNSPKDLDRIEFEPPTLDTRYGDFAVEAARHRSKGRAVLVKIGGPFIRSSFFRGETELLTDMAADEGFAKAVIEKVGAHQLGIGLESLRRAGAYGVWIADDICSINAPLCSPGQFERILLPVYRRLVAALKSAGARWVILHSDGNQMPLLDMLLDAGIDGLNPVEPSAGMDAVHLIERYHGRLSILGGLCNTRIFPRGDRDEIRRHVEPLIDAGRDGGLIIGASSFGKDVPVEAYEYFRELVAKRGTHSAAVSSFSSE